MHLLTIFVYPSIWVECRTHIELSFMKLEEILPNMIGKNRALITYYSRGHTMKLENIISEVLSHINSLLWMT